MMGDVIGSPETRGWPRAQQGITGLPSTFQTIPWNVYHGDGIFAIGEELN